MNFREVTGCMNAFLYLKFKSSCNEISFILGSMDSNDKDFVLKVCGSLPWNSSNARIWQILNPSFSGSSKWNFDISVVFIKQIRSFIHTESLGSEISAKVFESNSSISSPSQHDLYQRCLYVLACLTATLTLTNWISHWYDHPIHQLIAKSFSSRTSGSSIPDLVVKNPKLVDIPAQASISLAFSTLRINEIATFPMGLSKLLLKPHSLSTFSSSTWQDWASRSVFSSHWFFKLAISSDAICNFSLKKAPWE